MRPGSGSFFGPASAGNCRRAYVPKNVPDPFERPDSLDGVAISECETRRNFALCGLLVAIAVAGRWLGASVDWAFLPPNFTPVAAVGLFAGFLFASLSTVAAAGSACCAARSVVTSRLIPTAAFGWGRSSTVRSWRRRSWADGCEADRRPAGRLHPSCFPRYFFHYGNHRALDGRHPPCEFGVCRQLAGVAGLLRPRNSAFFRWMLEGDVCTFVRLFFSAYALTISSSRGGILGGWRRRRLASAHVSAGNSRC